MKKKFVVYALVLFLFLIAYQVSDILAQDSKGGLPESPGIDTSSRAQNVYGIVGKVDYTEYRSRGESSIIVEDKKGEKCKVSLKQIQPGATVLATYSKEKDKNGREKNVLVSLSIVKPALKDKAGKRRRR